MQRAELDICDIVASRSNADGMLKCLECRRPLSLQEAWREPNPIGSTASVFCAECARRVNRLNPGANIGPMSLTVVDKVNLGIFQEELVDKPQQPTIVESNGTRTLKRYFG